MFQRSASLLAAPLMIFLSLASAVNAPAADAPQTLAQKIAGLDRKDGLFPLDWDEKSGKLYLEIPESGKDFLLLDQLPYGLGSNDIGLDRGQLGEGRVVHFTRVGPKVLLVAPNLTYRSSAADPAERIAVKESFAESVLWGFKVEAEDKGILLVDATDFFLRDAHGVAERLQDAKQGSYHVDASRSAITLDNTKNFPKNTEVESILTFAADGSPHGQYVAEVTPDPHAITLREHTSLIELPDDKYKPRMYDPRSGFFSLQYRDYSVPLNERMDQSLLVRHRLEKRDPNAAVSEPVKPLTYYVDRGAPEPIRSALVEGARWWSEAFEAAGFRNAFHVEVLPEGADPMDIRYNMIQWVHRASRGWSYGAAVTDPRTGEIIKGQVTLGSLRARQDYRIAEALLAPYLDGKPIPPEMEQMVLARTRQLAAHEVGHTLGLQHNFAASSLGQGTSVMDYPHPLITLDASGKPTLDKAYAVGIGAWDKAAIRFGYSEFAPGTAEAPALDKLLRQNEAEGLRFITDEDSRPLGSANPYGHLWDNGPDASAELERILAIRKAALARFGADAVRPGEPMSQLEDTLVPLYLLHRYQTEAAAKLIGGLDYRYAVRGDGGMVTEKLTPERQRKALSAVLKTLDPQALTLPAELLAQLPPRPPGYPTTRESFEGHTGLTFDPQGAVEASAELTASLLFEPARASRLVEYHAENPKSPGLDEVIGQTLKATWESPRLEGPAGQTQFTVDSVILSHLLELSADKQASAQARAEALAQVGVLEAWLHIQAKDAASASSNAHWAAAIDEIERFRKDPEKFAAPPALATPPGQPIGSEDDDFELP
ncbi:zinc-dependent metalloprotease [Acidicapsa ligni]|uniref:zinc-dependent metalloprotease n=1 Tax=Acidicapsa ligni TaxID=542300 RepID=UPI0021DF5D90|nr:zinc-dependent metalloprotease [Acidicapsa ligni]